MPTGKRIPEKVKQMIYNAYTLGEKADDIATRTGLHVVTVRKVIRDQRKAYEREREEMSRSGKIVKKDGRGGKLLAITPEGFEFTHVTPDGRSHKKKVDGHLSRVAEQQYDKWCQELDDECEFMRRAERKVDAVEEELAKDAEESVAAEQGEAVCGYPSDPIEEIVPAPTPVIEVRPWKTVASEQKQEIEELNARIAELESKVAEYESGEWVSKESVDRILSSDGDKVVASTEGAEPKLQHWFNDNGSFAVVWRDKPLYVIWVKGENQRMYGVYQRIEDALRKVDELNDIAAFLGNTGAFEVEEVEWR